MQERNYPVYDLNVAAVVIGWNWEALYILWIDIEVVGNNKSWDILLSEDVRRVLQLMDRLMLCD